MKKFYRNLFFLLAFIFFLTGILTGCNEIEESSSTAKEKKPIIAVSIVPQETFVQAVGGELVDTVVLIPPGNNPENYAPSPQTLVKLSEATLYFSLGVPAEKANILPKIPEINETLKVIDLAAIVGEIYPHRKFAPNSIDPHIWLSPKRVVVMIETIAQELAQIDPENKAVYEENAQKYIEKLTTLDEDIKSLLADVPNKTFIIYHPSLGYFADDYGLVMIAIEEEGKEATIESIQKIIDVAKEKNIKVVFYQAEHDSKQAKTIAEELNGKTVLLDPLAPNYLENMYKIAETFADILSQ
ncbi:MAG: zinc ABC transporter solute-binding protein [Clostridia bacterium]|nr:zinc ABC transporter solute-binding protein [Clostridia bacterium]